MTKLDRLIKEVEELIEEYRAKVEAGQIEDISLHNSYSASQSPYAKRWGRDDIVEMLNGR